MKTNPRHRIAVAISSLLLAFGCQETDNKSAQKSDPTATANNSTETQPSIMPKPPGKTLGRIERLDPAIDKLLPANAQIELLAAGFDWAEGPVWLPGEK